MKKMTLLAALIIMSLQAKLCAQSAYQKGMFAGMLTNSSKAEQTFNYMTHPNIRAFVVLKEGKMILDLYDTKDFEAFKNFDSTLAVFMKDISFYRDSLAVDPTDHIRIDYVLTDNYSFKKIRFKKYKSDGNIFMNRDGEIAKLKFEQDTVRIIIQGSRPGISRRKQQPCTVPYTAQATLLLGNYTDINKLIADNILTHIMDTLQKGTQLNKRQAKIPSIHSRSVLYNPYYNGPLAYYRYGGLRYHRYNYLLKNEGDNTKWYSKHKFSFNPQVGAALVRNTFAPVADIGVQYNKYQGNYTWRNTLKISATGYYFFDKDREGNFLMNDNWFVNAEIGAIYDEDLGDGWVGKQAGMGIGYLLSSKGGYFKNTTFRLYTNIGFIRGLTIVPEIIIADNFRQIFPGIMVKILP